MKKLLCKIDIHLKTVIIKEGSFNFFDNSKKVVVIECAICGAKEGLIVSKK